MVGPATEGRRIARGQVHWVDFGPSRGSEQAGRRPALVVQNNIGNRFSPNTIVAAMTTKVAEREYPTEVRLCDDVFGKPCVVLCSQLLTVAQDRLVGEPAAWLDEPTMARVDSALRLSLGL